jgi:hypothetical protein
MNAVKEQMQFYKGGVRLTSVIHSGFFYSLYGLKIQNCKFAVNRATQLVIDGVSGSANTLVVCH